MGGLEVVVVVMFVLPMLACFAAGYVPDLPADEEDQTE